MVPSLHFFVALKKMEASWRPKLWPHGARQGCAIFFCISALSYKKTPLQCLVGLKPRLNLKVNGMAYGTGTTWLGVIGRRHPQVWSFWSSGAKEKVLHGAPPLRLPTTVKFGEIRGWGTWQHKSSLYDYLGFHGCTNCNWSLFTPLSLSLVQ
jgi:hypothetical protein